MVSLLRTILILVLALMLPSAALALGTQAVPGTPGGATATNQPSKVTSGSTTSGQSGTLAMCATTVAGRSDTTLQSNPIGCRLDGAVRVEGTTPIIFKGSLTGQALGYIAGVNIGGKITLTGLKPGQTYYIHNAVLIVAFTLETLGGATNYAFWDTNPSTSTLTDNSAVSISNADAANMVQPGIGVACTAFTATTSPCLYQSATTAWPRGIVADGSGQVYMEFSCQTAMTFTGAVYAYRIELRE